MGPNDNFGGDIFGLENYELTLILIVISSNENSKQQTYITAYSI